MNKYLLEAIDAYPFDLPQTMESLEYAMSYDDECPHSYGLMGRLYAEQLQEYDKALHYFEEAIQRDLYNISVYPHYISTLLNAEKFDTALKVIDFALSIRGSDRGRIYWLKALCFEYQKKYVEALKALKRSEQYSFNNDFKNLLKETRTRIEEKKSPKQAKHKRSNKKKVLKKKKK